MVILCPAMGPLAIWVISASSTSLPTATTITSIPASLALWAAAIVLCGFGDRLSMIITARFLTCNTRQGQGYGNDFYTDYFCVWLFHYDGEGAGLEICVSTSYGLAWSESDGTIASPWFNIDTMPSVSPNRDNVIRGCLWKHLHIQWLFCSKPFCLRRWQLFEGAWPGWNAGWNACQVPHPLSHYMRNPGSLWCRLSIQNMWVCLDFGSNTLAMQSAFS